LKTKFLPKKYREFLGLGVEIAATITVPIVLGYLLDIYLLSSPWGLLIGAVLGIVFFFFTVFRIAKKLDNKNN